MGLGTTLLALQEGTPFGAFSVGAWSAFPRTGTSEIDPYARALIARSGELPMGAGDGVAHFAHLGGFLGAWVYLKVLDRTTGARRFQARAVAAAPPSAATTSSAVARWSRIEREGLHPVNLEELDRVMAKLQREGVSRLTDGEKEFLERFSQR